MPKSKDLTGQVFGRLTVREQTEKRDSSGSIIWLCDCSCGNTTYAKSTSLTRGERKSCGCIRKGFGSYQYKDLTGKTFGRLLVIRDSGERAGGSVLWECQCECGNIVKVRTNTLSNGTSKSCGCYNKDKARILMNKKNETDCVAETRLSILNHKPPRNNTSGVRGVCFHKPSGRWIATIHFQKKPYYLGCFATLEQAAHARHIAEETLWYPFLEKHIGNCNTQKEKEEKIRTYLTEQIEKANTCLPSPFKEHHHETDL